MSSLSEQPGHHVSLMVAERGSNSRKEEKFNGTCSTSDSKRSRDDGSPRSCAGCFGAVLNWIGNRASKSYMKERVQEEVERTEAAKFVSDEEVNTYEEKEEEEEKTEMLALALGALGAPAAAGGSHPRLPRAASPLLFSTFSGPLGGAAPGPRSLPPPLRPDPRTTRRGRVLVAQRTPLRNRCARGC